MYKRVLCFLFHFRKIDWFAIDLVSHLLILFFISFSKCWEKIKVLCAHIPHKPSKELILSLERILNKSSDEWQLTANEDDCQKWGILVYFPRSRPDVWTSIALVLVPVALAGDSANEQWQVRVMSNDGHRNISTQYNSSSSV